MPAVMSMTTTSGRKIGFLAWESIICGQNQTSSKTYNLCQIMSAWYQLKPIPSRDVVFMGRFWFIIRPKFGLHYKKRLTLANRARTDDSLAVLPATTLLRQKKQSPCVQFIWSREIGEWRWLTSISWHECWWTDPYKHTAAPTYRTHPILARK